MKLAFGHTLCRCQTLLTTRVVVHSKIEVASAKDLMRLTRFAPVTPTVFHHTAFPVLSNYICKNHIDFLSCVLHGNILSWETENRKQSKSEILLYWKFQIKLEYSIHNFVIICSRLLNVLSIHFSLVTRQMRPAIISLGHLTLRIKITSW